MLESLEITKQREKIPIMPRYIASKATTLFAICALILLSVASIQAQEKATIENKGCLWKIKSKNNTVYLLGSVHVLKKENYPLPAAMDKAFEDADKLVLEVDLGTFEQPAVQGMILSKALYADNKTLQDNLSKEAYDLIKTRISELGLNIDQFNRLEPWFVALTTTVLKLQKLGFDANYGVDKYFFDKAKKANKEVLAFETAEYQIARFDEMSARTQELYLQQVLKELDSTEKGFNEIVGAWAKGDIDSLDNLLSKSLKEFPELYERLLVERNKNWIPKIEEFLQKDKNYLVVVGAAHLAGKDSVLNLLKAKGFTIEQ
jgi:hypothetical protein